MARIFMGTAGETGWQDDPDLSPPQVICLNKGGSGRWAFDATGPVLAAPTILLDGDIMALTEDGTLYKLHDFSQAGVQDGVFRRWSIPDEPGDFLVVAHSELGKTEFSKHVFGCLHL